MKNMYYLVWDLAIVLPLYNYRLHMMKIQSAINHFDPISLKSGVLAEMYILQENQCRGICVRIGTI